VTLVTVQSPGGHSVSALLISHGALGWGDLPGGGQIRITVSGRIAEIDVGGLIGPGLDALVDIALKVKEVLGCTPIQTVTQEFDSNVECGRTLGLPSHEGGSDVRQESGAGRARHRWACGRRDRGGKR
jgi:hypothetical protein